MKVKFDELKAITTGVKIVCDYYAWETSNWNDPNCNINDQVRKLAQTIDRAIAKASRTAKARKGRK